MVVWEVSSCFRDASRQEILVLECLCLSVRRSLAHTTTHGHKLLVRALDLNHEVTVVGSSDYKVRFERAMEVRLAPNLNCHGI